MIRQICPHCSQTVELPDATAGTSTACPRCGDQISVPAPYTPSVDPTAGPAASGPRPSPDTNQERTAVTPSSDSSTLDRVDRTPPPPGLAPPRPAATNPHPVPAVPSGYARTAALVLTPQGLAWIPVGCLTLIFLLTFLDWAGSYPGTRLYSQTAWQSLVGGYSVVPIPDVTADQPDIDAKIGISWWMWPYMLLLIVTLVVAWAERTLFRDADPRKLPDVLRNIWPHRFAILSGAAGLLLVLLLFQSALGFSLESAIRRHVDGDFAMNETNAATEPDKQKVAVEKAKTINGYNLQMTTARQLAVAAHVVALAAILGRLWLNRRGPNAAPPRALVQY